MSRPLKNYFLHGVGGPKVGEVTCLAAVEKEPPFTYNSTILIQG